MIPLCADIRCPSPAIRQKAISANAAVVRNDKTAHDSNGVTNSSSYLANTAILEENRTAVSPEARRPFTIRQRNDCQPSGSGRTGISGSIHRQALGALPMFAAPENKLQWRA